jgi:hypothetical protein
MDWLNELPPATGIDKVVGEMAKRLLEGPVIFRSPFWLDFYSPFCNMLI